MANSGATTIERDRDRTGNGYARYPQQHDETEHVQAQIRGARWIPADDTDNRVEIAELPGDRVAFRSSFDHRQVTILPRSQVQNFVRAASSNPDMRDLLRL